MVDLQRALLDELMGTARDLTEEQKKVHREPRWDDAAACACFLARFCPHDLFFNTKSDLGACAKLHDAKLKESFEQSSRHDQYLPRFEAELARTCEKLVSDLDRKVRRGRERLAQDVDLASLLPLSAEAREHLAGLEAKVAKLLEQSEALGEQGRIDEAQALMKKVEALNDEKTVALDAASSERGLMMSQEKKMALCEICGSFLIASETTDRTASHASGKQHIGYGMIRDFLKEYKEKRLEVKEAERVAKEKTMAAPSKSQDFKTSDREAVESERGNAAEEHGKDVASAARQERERRESVSNIAYTIFLEF
eukprot:SM000054S18161  [mRNA]  locus=s54:640979:643117:- [translate_table: standard]